MSINILNTINKKSILLFFFLASSFVLSTLVKPYSLSWLVKLLPMLLLIALAVKHLSLNKYSKCFILGLAFSACGDFLLDYNRLNWFIFGLGAFFIAHLFYLAALRPYVKNLTSSKALLVILIYSGYGAVMLWLLANGLGQLFVPVVAYMSILLLMALATVLSEKSNAWLVVGGISFVISDSLLGFDKFYAPITDVHFVIMISYYFAQFCLFNGFVKAMDEDKKAVTAQ